MKHSPRLRKDIQLIVEDLRPRFAELSVLFASHSPFAPCSITVKVEHGFKYKGVSIGVDMKNWTRKTYLGTARSNLRFIGFDDEFINAFIEWCQSGKAYGHRRTTEKEELRDISLYFFKELRGPRLKAVLAPSKKRITRITPHTAARVTAILFAETYPWRMSMTEANLKKIFTEYEKELSPKKTR